MNSPVRKLARPGSRLWLRDDKLIAESVGGGSKLRELGAEDDVVGATASIEQRETLRPALLPRGAHDAHEWSDAAAACEHHHSPRSMRGSMPKHPSGPLAVSTDPARTSANKKGEANPGD